MKLSNDISELIFSNIFSLIRDFSSENGKSKDRSVEDIKERFYQIQAVTSKQVQKVTLTTLSHSLLPRGPKIKAQVFFLKTTLDYVQ